MKCRRWLIRAAALLAAAALWLGAWQSTAPAEREEQPQPLWILKDSGGRLVQFDYANDLPVRTWPVYTALLPEADGREYTECDIDTLHASKRGAKRIIFSNDGLIYYTDDHYESFTLLYGDENQ